VRFAFAMLVLFAAMPSAHADDDKEQCVTAHGDAQLLRKKHALVSATKTLRVCAREMCPALVQKDCTRWLGEVEAEQPTIVVVATDENGADIVDVRVLLDGKPLVDRLDGSPIAIDPGEHVLRFERAGGKASEQRIVLHDGEKSRTVKVSFAEPVRPAPLVVEKAGIPAATWVFGAIGVASLGSFTYFGLSGRAFESELSSSCAPSCSGDDVAGVRRRYLVADISLGVSVVSLAVATYFAISGSHEQPKSARTIDVRPIAGGAFVGLATSF